MNQQFFRSCVLVVIAIVTSINGSSAQVNQTQYDLVIRNGRVIDPASGNHAVMNVGIRDGSIAKLTTESLAGRLTIDATGKTVAPGFIDLHTHSPFPFGEELQVLDGVTSALDLEAGAYPPSAYGHFIRGKARANYGASVGHYAIRVKVIEGKDQPYLVTELGGMVPGPAFQQQATAAQIEAMRKMIHAGIDDGGLGIGFLLDYMSSAVSEAELRMIFAAAKERGVVVWAHVRRGINGDIQPLRDVVDVAAEIGTRLHICHINANAMGEIGNWMKLIDEANSKGADITAEVFPYTAGSTSISADVFNRDWQTIFGITYEDVQWAETGEYFTKETWEEKRRTRPDGVIIHHYMKEDWLKIGLKHPDMMIATDAMPAINDEKKAAPNGAGSYTRLLAKYVRDERVLSLEEAFAKGSYYPARRLESFAPKFAKKGRIQEGADADLLVFDIANLKDNATYSEPYKKSSGWDYVIVGGEVVFDHGSDTGARPGRQVTSQK